MIEHILNLAIQKIDTASNLNELQQLKVELLGKQSVINKEMKTLGSLAPDERKELGQRINVLRDQIQNLIEDKQVQLERVELQKRFAREKLDLSLPAVSHTAGSIHPISQVMEELIQVFSKFGFCIKGGPSIESPWYNFTALNIPEDHPSRQMHDTFYLPNDRVLRTHTSPIQIRAMENNGLTKKLANEEQALGDTSLRTGTYSSVREDSSTGSTKRLPSVVEFNTPPFRFIAPGRTYRSDSDMTHTPMFHQIEALVVDKGIHMGHLKHVVMEFIRDFFEQDNIDIRFRPSFFPFTEPSAEVDIRMHGSDKWLEVLGCGMIHPKVLTNVNIDPEEYRGFAIGLGVERFAMLKYGIKDLRQFFEGDLRWLKHYSFHSFDIPSLASGLTK